MQAFSDMLGLLMHENTDIAGDVLELLKELTDGDVVQDSVRPMRSHFPYLISFHTYLQSDRPPTRWLSRGWKSKTTSLRAV